MIRSRGPDQTEKRLRFYVKIYVVFHLFPRLAWHFNLRMSVSSQNSTDNSGSNVSPAGSSGPEIIDQRQLGQLESLRISGNRSLFCELAELFLSEMPPRFDKIDRSVLGRDASDVAKLAHLMVGSAAAIGARQLQAELRALEAAAESRDWALVERRHKAVLVAWDALAKAISARLENSK